ncbi:LUD domain-containing protein [Paenibacillus sp. P96]|uniref:LUD domain-containing protein n=1 Tax=Paenibacillus zeirhizosphaerae TaxID=2987519 RepID=A0ABT9FQ88_9BACL|nr:LUD domain-containing protein [Paenibacillus sp. P96]MDP4096887.1 LUD domain-containing protein [Paenibacillus sp. P96]
MNSGHQAWLDRLEAESRAKQERFMGGIASRLKRPRVMEPPLHPLRGAPEFWQAFEWSEQERIDRFAANFSSVGGHVNRLATMKEASAFIADKAAEMGARSMLRQDQPELAALDLESAIPGVDIAVWNSNPAESWKAKAAEADFGIVMADYAAAYTGSVTVLSSAHKGRSVSLLPTVLFILIPVERLKTRLGEILSEFDQAGREPLPAGIHFISGPSRSSDIENDLTIGVHGPGVVYALMIGGS